MRNYLFVAITIIIFASCSTKKYVYRDYNGTLNKRPGSASSNTGKSVDKSLLHVDANLYTASTDNNILPLVETPVANTKATDEVKKNVETEKSAAIEAQRLYKERSKMQRKEFRQAMRHSMRRYVVPSSKKSTKRTVIGG